jgi:arylformamidase
MAGVASPQCCRDDVDEAAVVTSMQELIDISPLIEPRIGVWPGDTPFVRRVSVDMREGGNLTLSDIRTSLHVGAHADAPSHCELSGSDIASRSLHYYVGPCEVIRVSVARGERIFPSHLGDRTIIAPRILFRTGTFPDPRQWNEDFASLSPELVDVLHERGVILAGIDTPSVDPFSSTELEAHRALVRHDMASLEGLMLEGVAEGTYDLIALPLRIDGGDASPVRAVLRRYV